jgi:hypothetical protein
MQASWPFGPLGVIIGTLTLLIPARAIWRRRRRVNEARIRAASAPLPSGSVSICTEGVTSEIRAELVSSFLLASIGTFGLNQLLRLLILLEQCGLEALVGSVLVVENDVQLRTQFAKRVPVCYGERIVYGHADSFSGGFANKDLHYAVENIDLWGASIEEAVQRVVHGHLQRSHNRAPTDILLFQSLGGQAALGVPVVQLLHERFEETFLIALTALPIHTWLRARWEELKTAYEERGVFGWVLTDNLGPEPVTADYGMAALIVALSDTSLHGDRALRLNNTLSLALTRERGGVLVYQVAHSNVVAYPLATLPSGSARYYVQKQPVIEQVVKGLRRVEAGRGVWSAQLPVGEADTSTFDFVLLPLRHGDLTEVEDAVTAGRRLKSSTRIADRNGHGDGTATRTGEANYETQFASITTLVNPDQPVCPVVTVRLTAVKNGAGIVREIVKPPNDRTLLPTSVPQLPSGNGRGRRKRRAASATPAANGRGGGA